ncbi:Putative ribonuclease H protein At1g65750 [Linum perenne]
MSKLLRSVNSLCFGIICWSLWKVRNARLFSANNESANNDSAKIVVCSTVSWAGDVSATQQHDDRTLGFRHAWRVAEIAWETGPIGWVTINTDGAVDLASGTIAAGGLIRNEHGHCFAAFSMNIGKCSIARAELRGVVAGLNSVSDHGLRRVEIQVY